MRLTRVALVLLAGVAACATPGQVRRVETAVALANSERARGDSAQRAEIARIQIAQRRNLDSINAVARQLNDAIQRLSRDNAANFNALDQRLYQVVSLTSTGLSGITRLSNKIDNNLAAPPPAPTADTGARAPGVLVVPAPGDLLTQAHNFILSGAYPAARRALNQLLVTYPQAPEVADAYYGLGQAFEVDAPDSARVYYARVFTSFPRAEHAPSALYKLANLEFKSGNTAAARRYWQMIVDKYKDSLESESAQKALRDNP